MADEATTATTATTDATAADQTSADSTSTTATETATTSATDAGTANLGDAGKKALDAMKADRNKARDDLAALRSEFDAFKAKADGKEAEHAAAQEAQKVKDEALSLANDRIKKAEVRAAAKGKVADEALADLPALMDLSGIEVGADGEVDTSQIASAIDDLIKNKPYLAAQGSRFQGSADGGARNDATKVAQLTQADMGRMSPEQIAEAEAKGQFDDLLGRR